MHCDYIYEFHSYFDSKIHISIKTPLSKISERQLKSFLVHKVIAARVVVKVDCLWTSNFCYKPIIKAGVLLLTITRGMRTIWTIFCFTPTVIDS